MGEGPSLAITAIFFSEFAYIFRLSVSMRKVAGEHPFSVLIYMKSYTFHIYFILCILLSYLIFDFVCLTLSLAVTHGIAKYARTYIRRYAHTHTHKKKIRKSRKKRKKRRKTKKKEGGSGQNGELLQPWADWSPLKKREGHWRSTPEDMNRSLEAWKAGKLFFMFYTPGANPHLPGPVISVGSIPVSCFPSFSI